MSLPSTLVATLKTSVRVNGLQIPMTEAAASLMRFCQPFTFCNPDSQFEISALGSCFLMKQEQRLILIATKHQLSGREAREVCICIGTGDDRKRLMASPSEVNQIKFNKGAPYKFAEDILVLEFVEGRYTRPVSPRFTSIPFFDLSKFDPASIKLVFSLGYPSEFFEYDIDESDPENLKVREIKSGCAKLYLEYTGQAAMEFHDQYRIHPAAPVKIDSFDGFSGSPVFALVQDESRQCHIGYAGTIRLGGNGLIHAIQSAHVERVLSKL